MNLKMITVFDSKEPLIVMLYIALLGAFSADLCTVFYPNIDPLP